MCGMVSDPKFALDQLGDPGIVPYRSQKPKRFGTFGEQLHQSFQVCLAQTRWATAGVLGLQSLDTTGSAAFDPLAHRRRTHAHRFRNVVLFPTRLVQCPSSFSPFHFPFRFLSRDHDPDLITVKIFMQGSVSIQLGLFSASL